MGAKLCETCGQKGASFGDREERIKKWCARCAKEAHNDAVNLHVHMCTDCGLKQAGYGMPDTLKKLWCARCGKPKGAVLLSKLKRCEDCTGTLASCGLKEEGKWRWCGTCAPRHGGIPLAEELTRCEDGKHRFASFELANASTPAVPSRL